MSGFNLSEWALKHRSFIVYLMLISGIAGWMAYTGLGREEDPPFIIKTMVINTQWPGSTTQQMLEQVTDRIEKKLEELVALDYVRSYTKPGEAVIFVNLKDDTRATDVPEMWYQVRKKVNDIRMTLPTGVLGPFFNDEFGDTYSLVYAFTSDGFTHREMRDYLEQVRADMLHIDDVAKVDFIGTQDEKIYLEFSTKQMAALGINATTLMRALQEQNAVSPSGVLQTASEEISIRVSGSFASEKGLKMVNLRSGDHFYRLADIAKIKRDYVDPPQPMFRYNGQPAIGLALSMRQGGDILALGTKMEKKVEEIASKLPIGIDVHRVANQPHVVEEAVGEFTQILFEAIAIVLVVSFLALGWRPGIVVAIAIPLVLGITFVVMEYFEISLQRISLGALIIALGLLVDDAMIAIEMMIKKLEEGYDKFFSATFTYVSTAFPMLTGTLVTVAGFIPVGFAKSSAGEYTFTLFVVVAVSLIASWFVAVLFTPLLGIYILPDKMKAKHAKQSRSSGLFKRMLNLGLRFKYLVIAITISLFVVSVYSMQFVQQQFFPSSDRPELLVNVMLPKSASIQATEATVNRVEEILKAELDIEYWSFYIGSGAVRFYLPLDLELPNAFMAQAVVVTKGYEQRPQVKQRLEEAFATGFDNALIRVSSLELGPPVGWPLKFRVSGPDIMQTRSLANDFAGIIGQNPNVLNINYNWNELAKSIVVDVDQNRARSLGISSQQLASDINAVLSGVTITRIRDQIYLVDVVARAVKEERATLETLRSLQVATSSGRNVPLAQIASLSYRQEPPLVWSRDRVPTITVQADVPEHIQAITVVQQLQKDIAAFQARLPAGYELKLGGTIEDSAKAQQSIFVVFPLMLLVMITILMVQLMSFQNLALVLLTAPLGIIGVTATLLAFNVPMGFVSILGIISLSGMVIRNSVILIDQIEKNKAAGEHPWDAVVTATEYRLRPILLTAAAAILAMIPISTTVFWGPMAFAIMGGLAVATLLTLIFLPALYVTWYRLKPPGEDDERAQITEEVEAAS